MIASLFKKKHRFSLSRGLAVLIALAGFTAQGCIGDDEGGFGLDGAAGEFEEAEYEPSRASIKAYIKNDAGEYDLVEIRPVPPDEEGGDSYASKEQESRLDDGVGQKEQATVDLGPWDAGTVGTPIDAFLFWVGDTCRSEYPATPPAPFAMTRERWGNPGGAMGRFTSTVSWGGYFVYANWYNVPAEWLVPSPPPASDVGKPLRSCDHVLYVQSQLLCTANKLAEIADATGTVKLIKKRGDPANPTIEEVLIPPQATADRQYVRRLVNEPLAAMAHLGMVDIDNGIGATCGELYANSINDTTGTTYNTATYRPSLFNSTASLSLTDFKSAIRQRVRTWVENHRAALMLLKKNNRDMVDAGVATAEGLLGEGGLKRMWGNQLPTVDVSLRAVLGRQLGRVEVDSAAGPFPANSSGAIPSNSVSVYAPNGDLSCADRPGLRDLTNEQDIVDELFALAGARAEDPPPRTVAQQRAQLLVERLGVVLLPAQIKAATPGQLRTLVKQQLVRQDHYNLLQELLEDNPAATLDLTIFEGERGPVIDKMLTGISDADVAFALKGQVAVLAQLAEVDWPMTTFPPSGAGLTQWSTPTTVLGPMLGTLGGKVYSTKSPVLTGLPRSALATDSMALVMRAQAASQCGWTNAHIRMNRLVHVYQSPGDVATKLIDQLTEPLNETGLDLSEIQAFDPQVLHTTRVARAEFYGSELVDGIKHVDVAHGNTGSRIEWQVRIHGNEADYPAQGTLDNMQIALIYGRPWEADCLAGTRSACGVSFAPRHRLDPDPPLPGAPPAKSVGIWGNSSRTWTFLPKAGTSLPIVPVNPGDPMGDDIMYVVRLPANGLQGRVLAGFRPLPAATSVSLSTRGLLMSLSRSRNEAVQRVLNMSGMQNKGDRCVEGSSTGIPAESCVPGIFRNQYVPLANELTSDGGSIDNTWRHYLELAKSAAAEADGLGQELISLGLQRDLRIEGAQDELASLCGTFIDTADVDLSDGSGKSIVDEEVNACIDPPKTKFVFFQSGESGQLNATEISERLAAYCAAVPGSTYCTTPPAANDVRTLGLPPPPGPELGDTVPGCNPSPKSALSIMGGELPQTETYQHGSLAGYFKTPTGVFDDAAFQSLIGTEPYSRTGLAGAVSRLNFVENRLDAAAPYSDSGWALYGLGNLPLLAGISEAVDADAAADFPGALSAAPPEHTAWPLCRRISTLKGTEYCSPVAQAIERSFMGDGKPPVNQALDDRIRRAVEAGLWSMARLSGHLPSGLFTKVLPVANYGSAGTSPGSFVFTSLISLPWFATSGSGITAILNGDATQLATFQAPVPSIYSYGLFSKSGSLFTLREGHAAADAEILGNLRNLPAWFSQRWLTIGNEQTRLRPFFVEATTPASYAADKFIALRASNASMAFAGGPEKDGVGESVAGVGQLPFYGVSEWLEAALNSGDVPDNPAWEAMRRSILTGNRPGGSIDLVRDGILYSHVVARPDQCGQEAKDANLGDILPEHAGMQASDGAYIYRSLGDSWPAAFAKRNPVDRATMNGNDTNPPQILFDNGEDGMYRFEGVLFTDLNQVAYCDSTTCKDAQRGVLQNGKYVWPRIKGRFSLGGRVRLQQASDEFGGSGDSEAPGCKEYDSEFTADLLSASVWPPSKRVHMFVDPGSNIRDNVAMMGALSCLAQTSLKPALDSDVPTITDVRQIPLVRQWVDNQARQIARWQETLFLTDVPTSVVDNFANGTVNFSEVGSGQKGARSLELAQSFLEIHAGFTAIYDAIRRASAALKDAETSIAGAEISGNLQLNSVAMQRAQTIGGMVKATISAAGGILGAIAGFPNPGAMAENLTQTAMGYADLAIGSQVLGHVNEADVLTQELIDNSKMQILQRMSESAASAMTDAQNAMVQIQTAHLNALRAQNALDSLAGNARLQMARATGADFADVDGNGTPDALPVNTVYRRNYDVLQRRYEEALSGAKRYAYLARLSIEQKLGVRLRSVDEAVGPVPPPNGWVDSLCQLTGVDYDKLRDAADPDEVSDEEALIDDFADQYIGEYVRQLEQFVEFYNVKYPFREEADAAVLSLRDDLVYGDRRCRREARNLLYYSDRLGSGIPETDPNDPYRSVGGWRIGPETFSGSQGARLAVIEAVEKPFTDPMPLTQTIAAPYPKQNGMFYSDTGYLESPTKGAGVSILRTDRTSQPPMSVEYGPVPPLSTYQTVPLFGGTLYLLSWYDMARSIVGGPAPGSTTYRVMVVDANWTPLAILDPTAAPGGVMDNVWSERRVLPVYVEESGDYHIIISPVTTGTSGAVAIANVQLEAAVLEGPQDYEATTGTREINAFDCGKGNGKMLRDSFVRRCDAADDCYYELAKPISLHEGRIASGEGSLPGLAADNFNYRHAGLAVNVVGTGVLDCSNADQSCFSQGFLEYDLVHSAFNAELRDHADEPRCFNFGRGATRHGKALAAERYLGVPMSSTDREFLQSNEFMQEAFTGRPLSGQYNLRIYETPELRWEQIEDIQLYLQYGYWSRVETAQ